MTNKAENNATKTTLSITNSNAYPVKIKRIYKRTEAPIQASIVRYCRLQKIPIAAIPNERKQSSIQGYHFKRMGVAKGFPDLIIPIQNKKYGGLFIECKSPKGSMQFEQKIWRDLLIKNGYQHFVVRSLADFIKIVTEYLK